MQSSWIPFVPDSASTVSGKVDALYFYLSGVTVFFTLLISGVLNEGRPIPFETLGTKDFSEVYVGVSQDLPYPGKRGLRENVAREEVAAAKWAYEAVRRSVAAQVAETYYDLYSVHAALDILGMNLDLLEQFTKIARARTAMRPRPFAAAR